MPSNIHLNDRLCHIKYTLMTDYALNVYLNDRLHQVMYTLMADYATFCTP